MITCLTALLVSVPAQGITPFSSTEITNPTPDPINQGRRLYQQQQYQEAIQTWQQALDSEPNPIDQAMIWSYLSLAYQAVGDWEKAEKTLQKSLALLPEESPARILGAILNTQGQLYLGRGQLEAALGAWEQAAIAYSRGGDQEGRIGSMLNQAQALQNMGLYRRSQALLTSLLPPTPQPPTLLQIQILRSLGVTLHHQGDFPSAQTRLEDSLTLAESLANSLEITQSRLALGNLERDRKAAELALHYYQQAATTDNLPLQVKAELNQLRLHIETEQFSLALALITSIPAHLAQLPPSQSTINAIINFTESLAQLDRAQPHQALMQMAAQWATEAKQQAHHLSNLRAEALATLQLGKLYAQTQQLDIALKLTQEALFLAQTMTAEDIAIRATWQQGQLLVQQGQAKEALSAYRSAFESLESLKGDLVAMNPESQFSFTAEIDPVYRELIALLLQPEGESKDQIVTQKRLEEASKILESLQLMELDYFFREGCRVNEPRTIDQIDPEAAVIYPIILPDRLEVILTLPKQPLERYSTAIAQKDLEQHLQKMRQSLHPAYSNQERFTLYQQAYQWLIQPAEAALKRHHIKTLVFVLDSRLQNVPMAALFNGQQYLIEEYAIATTNSLRLVPSRPLTPQKLQALTAGLSQPRQGFRPLPGVATEVQQIANEITTRVLLDQDFTSPELQKAIEETPFPILHLATHGQFSSNADETFILTWDGRINVRDLDQLLRSRSNSPGASLTLPSNQPIELLVLSACQTAQGDERAILGLAGVALRSGARSTLATLWAVRDESTAQFMVEFYQQLSRPKITKAKALQQAQLSLLHSKYHHPIYWAPFVLVGNWL